MQKFTEKITFVKNGRGIWDLDPFKGCEDGIKNNVNGCYGLCYAAKSAKIRGFDFSKTVYRYFKNEKQIKNIGKKLQQTSFIHGVCPQFIRLGVMCDPSFDWKHTLNIIDKIKKYNPNIVIITKHWKPLEEQQLQNLKKIKHIYINTSISALDTKEQIENRLEQYKKLKKYCSSILRVNTADFNNLKLKKIQEDLLKNENVIDNILRISPDHYLSKNNIVNIKKYKFINNEVWASKVNEKTYFGICDNCPEQCGINFLNS